MQYEKKIMRVTELYKMGIPKTVIQLAIAENKEFIRKTNPVKKNSPLVVDTEEFDKWWVRKNITIRRLART